MSDLRGFARQAAVNAGIDPGIFERQIDQESGFNPNAFNAGSGATGIAQIIPRFHPDVDPRDPEASLVYAAGWMRRLVDANEGGYARALASYNWGPGNVGGFTRPDGTVVPRWDGRRTTLPAETRLYLDRILGTNWQNGQAPVTSIAGSAAKYVFPVQGYRDAVQLHHGTFPGASDLFASRGTPVLAMHGGRVDGAGDGQLGGNFVIVTGDDGLDYYYAHGDRLPAVQKGARISTGTFLFGVGDTGNAVQAGPHLHIGIGHGILDGAGPTGGAGANFDAVALLREVLTGGSSNGNGSGILTGSNKFRVASTGGIGLNLRDGPSTTAAIIRSIPEGDTLEGADAVIAAEGRTWQSVREPDGAVGFVASEFLMSDGERFRVANTDGMGLNLRQRPSATATIVKSLFEGAVVEPAGVVLETEGRTWRSVRDRDGNRGWAAAAFLVAV
jgi:murein DD-endopeptidase MepM/ murein hydrolase activator NlpD